MADGGGDPSAKGNLEEKNDEDKNRQEALMDVDETRHVEKTATGESENSEVKSKKSKPKKNKKRKLDESFDLEGSFPEEQINTLSDAVSKVSTMIENIHQRVNDKKTTTRADFKDLKEEVEEMNRLNDTLLKTIVKETLEKGKKKLLENAEHRLQIAEQSTEFDVDEKIFCDRCAIVIEREEEEKQWVLDNIKAAAELEDDEYAKLINKKWPDEAFRVTKEELGNPLSTKDKDLIIFYDTTGEDSTLMRLVKDKFPEVDEVLGEKGEEEDMPFLENIINTKKGSNKKRIYFVETKENAGMRQTLKKCAEKVKHVKHSEISVAVSNARKRKLVKKSLEIAFENLEVNIKFYIPSRDTRESRGNQGRSEAVVIGTDVSTYAETLRNIRAVVNPEELGIQVRKVKTTKDKKVVIVTEEGQAATLQREIAAKVNGIETRVSGRTTKTSLMILDIDASINGKEVEEFIRKTTKVYNTEVKSLRMGRSGTQIATVSMPAGAAEELLRQGDMKIGWTRCRVKPKVDIIMCYNCLHLGHHSDICQADKSEKRCLNCTQTGHLIRECQNRSFCTTCNKEGHRCDSSYCPTYKRRIEEATNKIYKNIKLASETEDSNEIEMEVGNEGTQQNKY